MTMVVSGGELAREEKSMILEKAKAKKGCDHVTVTVNDEWLDIDYHIMPFERIRRIA